MKIYFRSQTIQTDLGSVESGSVTGRNGTAQQADLLQRGLLIHFGQRYVSHHGVLWEGAAAHEVEQALAFAWEAGGPVRHQAFALCQPRNINVGSADR